MEGILLANSLSRERANGLDPRGIGTPGSKLLNRRRKHLVYELLHSSVAVRVRPDFVQRLQSDVIDFEDLQARKIAQRRNAFFKIVIVPELNGSLEDDLANRALNALQGPSSIQRRPLFGVFVVSIRNNPMQLESFEIRTGFKNTLKKIRRRRAVTEIKVPHLLQDRHSRLAGIKRLNGGKRQMLQVR